MRTLKRLVSFLVLLPIAAFADERVPGPVPAQLVRVIDGDTVVVHAHIWLGQYIDTAVRLAGVDAAEMHARCDSERALALEAKAFVEAKLADPALSLADITYDKYGRRVVARIITAEGQDLSDQLMAAGLVHAYDGGRKEGWCSGDPPDDSER